MQLKTCDALSASLTTKKKGLNECTVYFTFKIGKKRTLKGLLLYRVKSAVEL